MASFYSEPPIEPFCRPQEDTSLQEQTVYTISKEDVERLAPYLPPKRSEFLRERQDSRKVEDEIAGYSYATQSLPHVTLTYAQSLDSQISLRPGQRTTLSGVETKAMTQFLRTHHDAILIGAGTANADNPRLNTSFSYDGENIVGLAEQPRPLILDPGRSWSEEKCEKMFRLAKAGVGRAPWWIICEEETKRDEERIKKIKEFGGGIIKAGRYGRRENGVEWEKILNAMWDTGIRSVMIEGGATVINDLLRARNQHLVTSVIVTIAPTYLGSGGVVVAPPRSLQDENEARLSGVTWIPFGQDVVMAGRLAPKS
jgi:2,5-diamino-6-(ribosylamino)-4(3H)-pyrimidinone 5'-phosphate reductase